MEEDALTAPYGFLSPPSSSKAQNASSVSPVSTSTPLPPSVARQWRQAARRNLRNRWSELARYRRDWTTHSDKGRRIVNSLVNNYLSQRYIHGWELGVLGDMPDIRKKACRKWYKRQEADRSKLLSCYKDMVATVVHMVHAAASMRCFSKGIGSPLVQFSFYSDDGNDSGDGGGIPVFTFLPISSFEQLAAELVQIFALELNLKRLLVMELLLINSEEVPSTGSCWSDELYPGEFDDLCICDLYSKEASRPNYPKIEGWKSDISAERPNHQPDPEVLQVYQTTWLAEVNIDTYRVEEIFDIAGEEIQVTFS